MQDYLEQVVTDLQYIEIEDNKESVRIIKDLRDKVPKVDEEK